jgi:hypothetical protein
LNPLTLHFCTPDVGSDAEQWMLENFGSFERLKALAEIPENLGFVGGVVSSLMVTDFELVPPTPLAEQLKVDPVVLELTVAGEQPVVLRTEGLGSPMFHAMVTGDRNQPFAPFGAAGLSASATVGGVFACVTTRSA